MSLGTQILVIGLLILANGGFAMAEIALVSARRLRLERLAREGRAGARAALELSQAPDRFLATVQVGITLIGIAAGAFGGATVAEAIAPRLGGFAWIEENRDAVALALVVAAITYASLIFGELVPKRLGLANPEAIASATARPMRLLARVAAPVVYLLSLSSTLVVKLLPFKAPKRASVTEEEIRMMIAHGTTAGVVLEAERALMENVFRLGDRRVNQLMTPRSQVTWLPADAPLDVVLDVIVMSGHSQFPVCEGGIDDVLGMVWVKDLIPDIREGEVDLRASVRDAVFVPETARALRLPELLRGHGTHAAIVIDEYGGVQGIVTLADVLESLIGELPEDEDEEPDLVRREDGSYLVEATMPVEELIDLIGARGLPGFEAGHYQTVAGFVLHQLRRLPATGDAFEWGGWRFEVVDMDGNRIDKLLIARKEQESD